MLREFGAMHYEHVAGSQGSNIHHCQGSLFTQNGFVSNGAGRAEHGRL